ncbi:SAM-dependent methyltransferase [Gemelliphila palaticanis]|uniref:Tetrapyrrole methylase n=1 Tax=Gemelliphila palaticanis TaxID=81950 RepID=A0ABX2SZJ3_9BACL|nr:SAM-dependent methyltransferase [Gemella palaticanis]MBF0714838.1 tetrapyrrole methylase [Gemella palaticanis]NYS46768.1 tetrapyrrole methylase [Gemella palaticanis]
MIYIIGLGPNEEISIKENIKNLILENKDKTVIARTKEHFAISFLDKNNIEYETCDKFYESSEDFSNTYEKIAEYILSKNEENDVLYLLPGHPMVAEMTTKLIINKTDDYKIIGGESFLDICFNYAGFDPVEGFILIDATNIESFKDIDPSKHILITQCYDDLTAANISVELEKYYPYNHNVLIMENVGSYLEKKYNSELYELSSIVGEEVNNLRTVYIPPYKEYVSYNLKNYLPEAEFFDEKDTSYLIEKLETSIKNIKDNRNIDNIEKNLAELIRIVLDFENASDEYYSIDNIIKILSLKEYNNG